MTDLSAAIRSVAWLMEKRNAPLSHRSVDTSCTNVRNDDRGQTSMSDSSLLERSILGRSNRSGIINLSLSDRPFHRTRLRARVIQGVVGCWFGVNFEVYDSGRIVRWISVIQWRVVRWHMRTRASFNARINRGQRNNKLTNLRVTSHPHLGPDARSWITRGMAEHCIRSCFFCPWITSYTTRIHDESLLCRCGAPAP